MALFVAILRCFGVAILVVLSWCLCGFGVAILVVFVWFWRGDPRGLFGVFAWWWRGDSRWRFVGVSRGDPRGPFVGHFVESVVAILVGFSWVTITCYNSLRVLYHGEATTMLRIEQVIKWSLETCD